MDRPKGTLSDHAFAMRFWARVDRNAPGGCWVWTAALNAYGYGVVRHHEKVVFAHRVSFTALIGPVPEGLELDHLCRNRACVNPKHLRRVTHRENMLVSEAPNIVLHRSGKCRRGHPFEIYSRTTPNGHRHCIECDRMRGEKRRSPVPQEASEAA